MGITDCPTPVAGWLPRLTAAPRPECRWAVSPPGAACRAPCHNGTAVRARRRHRRPAVGANRRVDAVCDTGTSRHLHVTQERGGDLTSQHAGPTVPDMPDLFEKYPFG